MKQFSTNSEWIFNVSFDNESSRMWICTKIYNRGLVAIHAGKNLATAKSWTDSLWILSFVAQREGIHRSKVGAGGGTRNLFQSDGPVRTRRTRTLGEKRQMAASFDWNNGPFIMYSDEARLSDHVLLRGRRCDSCVCREFQGSEPPVF